MASIEELDKKCLENYGFDLRETYKVTVKFYKGMSNESFEKTFLSFQTEKIKLLVFLKSRKIP